MCACVQIPSSPDPKAGSGSFSVPGGGASLQAASSVNKQEPTVRPAACAPRSGGRGAARRGQWKLDGAPARRDRGRVAGARAPSGTGRRAWPARPASAGLGRCRCRRRSGGTSRLPSRRPAPGPALGLCHCTCPGARGALAARPGRAPRLGVICPGRGLAPGASGPRRRPGRPRALGLTRLGYGAGEVGAGSLRGPSGALRACLGAASPAGPGAAAGSGRDCPPRALRPRSERRVALARRPNMVGAKPRPPLPFRLVGRARPRALPAAASRGARPPSAALSATAWGRLGEPFQVPGASDVNSSSFRGRTGISLWL